jgi:hypothetical protein
VGKLGLLPYGEDVEQPRVSEEDFFALERLAAREAARIYRALAQDAGRCPERTGGQEDRS